LLDPFDCRLSNSFYISLISLNNLHFCLKLFTMLYMGEIREQQKAKLSFKMPDNSEKEFDCQIKEVQNDRLLLEFPKEMLNYAQYLEEGSEMPVRIFTPTGVKMFDTIVLNSPLESDFVIEYVEDAIKVQRREYQRVNLETKLIIERPEKLNLVVKTIDMSGGGLRFYSEAEFENNESVEVLLYLPYELHSVKAQGIILNQAHLAQNEHVLLFTKIDEKSRDKIIQRCLKIQFDEYRII